MNCVILFRVDGGPVRAVMSPDGKNIYEFAHYDDAVAYTTNTPNQIGQADAQIVELDEL